MLANLPRINSLRTYLITSIRVSSIKFFSDKKSSSYDSDSSDDEKPKKKTVEKKTDEKKPESAIDRLNKLLASMPTDDHSTLAKSVKVTKPGKKLQKQKEERKRENDDKPKNVIDAAKKVASSLGGDVKQTESELLSKLLIHSDGVDPVNQSQSGEKSSVNLNELIVGMKIDRVNKTKPQQDEGRSQYVRRTIQRQQPGRQERDRKRRPEEIEAAKSEGSVNLFGSAPLGIFKNIDQLKDSPDILTTWNILSERELKLAVTHPPANYFQKMALWTDQGKLWKFPINNEQGMEDEHNVSFTKHVFLEQHLEGWCPAKGPIRHFMELVCVGLSKNPYISVTDKENHINWFKDYFQQKKDVLKDLIAEQPADSKIQLEK